MGHSHRPQQRHCMCQHVGCFIRQGPCSIWCSHLMLRWVFFDKDGPKFERSFSYYALCLCVSYHFEYGNYYVFIFLESFTSREVEVGILYLHMVCYCQSVIVKTYIPYWPKY